MSNRLILFMLLVVLSAIFVAGLWPFEFHPENRVSRLRDDQGASFGKAGIIHSAAPFHLSGSDENQGGLTIMIRCRPDTEKTTSVARILSVFSPRHGEIFLIGQWKSYLIISTDPSVLEKGNGRKKMGAAGLVKDKECLITFTSDRSGSAVYIDGTLVKRSDRFVVPAGGDGLAGFLILGNSPAGKAPWTGSLYGCALYGRTLRPEEVLTHVSSSAVSTLPSPLPGDDIQASYLFTEGGGQWVYDHSGKGRHLLIPKSLTPLQRVVLSPPWEDFRMRYSYFEDVIVNIAGFIPLGLCLCLLLRRYRGFSALRAVMMSLVFGCSVSLCIELVQSYLPARNSSMTDLVMNTLGTAIGAVIASGKYQKTVTRTQD